LQILDDGRLTDGKWRTVDFRNTIIIMTSNIWSGFIETISDKNELQNKILEQLKQYFKPEFINRIDDIVIYDKLDKEALYSIIDLLLEELTKLLKEKEITVTYDKSLKDHILEVWYDEKFWARPLKRAITKYVTNPLSTSILAWEIEAWDSVKLGIKNGELKLKVESIK